MRHMVLINVLLLIGVLTGLSIPAGFQDRFVWVFGWGLGKDEEVAQIREILEAASKYGYNGAVLSARLDSLCKRDDGYFRRLREVQEICNKLNLELIPSVFSVGYGGGVLAHDRNLAEGLPVKDSLFIVKGNKAFHVPDHQVQIVNGGFEEFEGNRAKGYAFHDEPGKVSFIDTHIKHSGNSSLRFENFQAHPYRNARVMQEIKVNPHRCYRVSLWVKTEGLQPSRNFRILVLAGNRDIAPRSFNLPPTTDWRKVTMIFNSMEFNSVRLYAGVWSGREGKFWLDDWTIEEIGPYNVLRRPGTPVTVKNEDGSVTYEEGKDYAPLVDANLQPYRYEFDYPEPVLTILPGSRIKDGQKLRVSWYHPMVIYESQVTVCMGEPALYEIFEHEAKMLWERVRYRKVLLNMDEVRMGGTCKACEGRNMAQLLGECVTKQVKALRRYNPEAEIYIWSDMFDPNHNARPNYYLVNGDFTGSWNYIPKDIIIAVWGGTPREKSLKFFEEQGFKMLIACYYDADTLRDVEGWLNLAKNAKNVRGFMYTTWERKYKLLEGFGRLVFVDK
ncbi:MAG: carbohydrate binding domain-containing protein [Armatimonadota bacterium]|nr:carbohydrate binding domain-containing protein [Armatimonadota bacterium]MDW8025028.1 carbohydrate binding domain-containing protein [Armatimonadota bacterium]